MGAIVCTIFIDLVGFSIIFPLLPAVIAFYLPKEGAGSFLGHAEALLASLSPAAGAGSGGVLTLVLFGGAVGSLYSILQFLSSPFWGRLSDHFGRRKVLLLTTLLTSIGYLVWVFSGSLWGFVLSRVINGLMAGNLSVATAAVADVTAKGARMRGMAIMGVSFALGFLIGPAIGGAASMVDLTRLCPEGLAWGLNPFSFAALVSFVLSIVNFVWVAARFPETLEEGNRSRFGFSFNPLSNMTADNPASRSVIWMNLSFTTVFSALEFTLTFLALERLHFGPVENISLFVFGGVMMTGVQWFLARRNSGGQGDGMRRLVMWGVVLTLAGMAALALADEIILFFTGQLLKSWGLGLLAPTLTSMASLYTPPNKQGAIMGAYRAAGSLARAVGPVVGAVLYWGMGSRVTYLAGAFVLLLPLGMAMRLPDPGDKDDLIV
jgi:MFS family permease